jgi:hypothetical protein
VEGFYTRDGDTLTMTDRDGVPLRDDNNGERITVRLLPTDNEKTVAKRTTLRLHRAERGDDVANFRVPFLGSVNPSPLGDGMH